MQRRDFLRYAAMVGAGAASIRSTLAAEAPGPAKLRKAIQARMLPKALSWPQRFELARKCGFEGVESGVIGDLAAAEQLGKQARDAGTPIHSIVYGGWSAPLSDPNPATVERGLAGVKTALASAKAQGASAVLLVPAVVKENVGYADAYKRSQENIRKLIPHAQEHEIIIAVENVWNKFLLSPLEFARYVDEFESPYVRAYFDVGNVIIHGYAQDWIRTLGKRIVKIHLKDFKRNGYLWKNLLEGDVNWPQVRRALEEVGYDGYLTPELQGGNEEYLTDLAGRMDKIIAMT